MKKNKKAFRYSVNSSVIIVGAIIITLLLNAILVTLNDRFSLEIDFTEEKGKVSFLAPPYPYGTNHIVRVIKIEI